MPKAPTVILGLSGGVDSSVSALLLKNQGFDVQALFMKNWEEDDTATYCSAENDLNDAKAVCKHLDIPLHTINFAQEYWERVFSLFLEEIQAGRTPNPDALCNQEIKFKAFFEYALSIGADFIATGHYAQKSIDSPCALYKGADNNKDQTYFIYPIPQKALARTLFPIGLYPKSQVRLIAQEAHLPVFNKKDSTGICFIGERKFKTFLDDFVLAQKGIIETPEGERIGEHAGVIFYTLGQRQGLGIGGKKGANDAPWYVVGKNINNNILYATQDKTHPWHFSQHIIVRHLQWPEGFPPDDHFTAKAKVRYRQVETPCEVRINAEKNNAEVILLTPQRAVTPGQSIVFYDGNRCLGGGIIAHTDSPGGLRNEQ